MMKIYSTVKSQFNQHEIIVRTNDAAKEISIAPKPSGYGSSVNGGELLLLALATCFCNDIYREAAKRKITVTSVEVECTADFGSDGDPGANFQYKTKVTSDAPDLEIQELIRYTDGIAEIHKTLRNGANVTLVQ